MSLQQPLGRQKGITVLGIGNPLMGDDGVGLVVLNGLMAESRPTVEFIDGGTIGLSLLPIVLDTESLLVLDAVDSPDAVPGSVVHLSGDQLPRLLRSKLSPHQIGLLDVLTAARLLRSEPVRTVVIGVVPKDIDLRLGLSATVAAAVPAAVESATAILRSWERDPAWAAQS